MSTHPSKLLPLFVLAALVLCARPGLCVQELLKGIQEQARYYRSQGYELQKQGELEAALSYYQKAIYLDPQYVLPYNDAGIVYEVLGQPEVAKGMYQKAIAIAPLFPESYSNLALLYEGQQDYVNAILNWMKRATLGGADDPWAETARKKLEEIARSHPEAYSKVGNKEYKENISTFTQQVRSRQVTKEKEKETEEVKPSSQQPQQTQRLQAGPPRVALRRTEAPPPRQYATAPQRKGELAELPELKWPVQDASAAVSPSGEGLDTTFQDSKTRALNYLVSAKEYFARGEYVAALREATVAEYLDSSNREISAFVDKVRKTLLQ